MTFLFLDTSAIRSGSKIVRSNAYTSDHVSVSAVQTTGNDGIVYNSIYSGRFINALPVRDFEMNIADNGKISITLREIDANRLLVQDTVKISADIHEQ